MNRGYYRWTAKDDMLACEAYRLADAMIAQREKQE